MSPHPPLEIFCRQLQQETNPRAYRKVLGASQHAQRLFAAQCIQRVHFVREQFRLIFEHIEDNDLEELKSMPSVKARGVEFVRMYNDMLHQAHSHVTPVLHAVSMIYATTSGCASDRLYQLEHPALHRTPLPQNIIDHPRGQFMNLDAALCHFHTIVKKSMGADM